MFSTPPLTYDTGEDMPLWFSSKVLGNIPSYICKHATRDECSDISFSRYADDEFASFRTTSAELRKSIETYWLTKGLQFIEKN